MSGLVAFVSIFAFVLLAALLYGLRCAWRAFVNLLDTWID